MLTTYPACFFKDSKKKQAILSFSPTCLVPPAAIRWMKRS